MLNGIAKNKKLALDKFTRRLRDPLGDKILGIYLFGSTAKGTSAPDSDVDMLVVYTGIDEHQLLELTSEISFEIALSDGELIEPVTISKEEYERGLGHSPFLWEVLTFGKPIFTRLSGTEWVLDFQDYLQLANEYLGYARGALKRDELRLSIDAGYNAAELLVKALIISTGSPLAASHGGIVRQFGKLFVLAAKVDRDVGRGLNLSLELRAKARYRPRAELRVRDAQFVADLVGKLLAIAEGELGS